MTEPNSAAASSVADEAARLAQAFSVWAQRDGEATTEDTARPGEHDRSEAAACGCSHGDAVEAVCRMCPVCRAAGLLQAVQPELLDRIADVLTLIAGGLHSAADQRREETPRD
ncbi:hypothetical protein [Flexivirga caeni]|uniref:hypothetical protein n=1 Tax=Flexivirga caeni TaxID=2294115 RepID=UPI0011CDCF71|nr:hypothetical protein [Flexivirga caeni]